LPTGGKMRIIKNKVKRNSTDQSGFTLLEILVALVLISLVIVSVLELSSANLRNLASADDQVEAAIRANSKMREIIDLNNIEEKAWMETDEQGYNYEITIAEALQKRTEGLPVKLEEVTLVTSWSHNNKKKQIILQTAKIVSRLDALKSDKKQQN
jgi:prepilin-type N-terminal cleavage/methylation domain-containing protein